MNLLATNFKQKNDWTCGPAVARVILDYYGHKKGIKELVRELDTTRGGTSNRSMVRLFRRHRIPFRARERASLGQLKGLLRRHIIVTAYWIPRAREAHFSIVTKLDRRRIYFHDTYYGSRHSYALSYFEKNWWDDEAKGWLLAIPK